MSDIIYNSDIIHNPVLIFSNKDFKKLLPFGQTIKTEKSLMLWQILIEKKLTAKQVGQIIDDLLEVKTNDNPKLPNLLYHLQKMVKMGLLIQTKKLKNGHMLKYFKAVPFVLIVPDKFYDKAIKSKTLQNTINQVFKNTT